MNTLRSKFFTNVAPLQQRESAHSLRPIIPVFDSCACRGRPVGIARGVGYITRRRELVKVFRLTIPGVKSNGLWICHRGMFVRLPGDE
jgi:hypothetical protein